ncbi:MAG: OmpA family protein [Gemmatimonadota bacterium]|nr:OmpA family protein [Gemmatimonadota bacterium]
MRRTRFPRRPLSALLFLIPGILVALPAQADGQLLKRVGQSVKRAAEDEVVRNIEALTRDKVRCVFTDQVCIERAADSGEEVVLTDDEGEFILDEEGMPVSDPEQASDIVGKGTPGFDTINAGETPGLDEAFANYDFVPGDEVLFYDDYSQDNLGDFPRRMTFRKGNWDVVEWNGGRYLRNTGPRGSALEIPLSKELPETFTIELEAYFGGGNHQFDLATSLPSGSNSQTVPGNLFNVGVAHGTGVASRSGGVESKNRSDEVGEGPTPVRIMVDGRYAKVYVGHRRVANVPNAEIVRSGTLYLENIYAASPEAPALFGPVRVAAGGKDLYDVLESEGRVVTHGILFAVNSATIRPESTPTLAEIAGVLSEHPGLRLSIEGHTDSDGDDAHNLDLSDRRAEAVKATLIDAYGIEASRLESTGHGESEPVAPNDTPEGKQKNRRVELVRIS